MNETEKRIAKVTDVRLGYEDHGIFTCVLTLDYGHSGQGAGLYALDAYDEAKDRRIGTAYGMEWLIRLMKVFGVDQWDQIKGRTCYATATHSKVLALGPLPTEPGEAFVFDDLRAEMEPVMEGETG